MCSKFHNDNTNNLQQEEDKIEIKAVLAKLTSNWILFTISVLTCLSLAATYIYFSSSGWKINNKILVEDRNNRFLFKPNKSTIYIFGLILGLLLPAIYLFIKELLNIRINAKDDLVKITNIPVIGEISHDAEERNLVVDKTSRSVVSGQFRAMGTNLQFILKDHAANVILLTSSMSGEGKSFIALNLGSAFALNGKKVVFMELDLRKPKLSENMGINNSKGYTDYAISDSVKIDDILKPLWFHENCFLIPSGAIPPDPAELLTSQKLKKIIDGLKRRFDYIIIDCAPVGLVTDALLIEKLADITLYVVRQEYTYKSQLGIVNDLKLNKKVKNIYIIVNDVVRKNDDVKSGGKHILNKKI